jgi:addiction module HigA family antidote
LISWIHQRGLLIFGYLQEIVWKSYPVIGEGSTALVSTINIEYVSSGQMLVQTMSRLLTTIKGKNRKVGEIGMVRIPTHRAPTHPGEMLLEEFLNPMNLTQRELAEGIRVPYQRVNEIINGKRGITPSTAIRLAKFFGNSEGFWMNLQLRWDLYRARDSEASELKKIQPVHAR